MSDNIWYGYLEAGDKSSPVVIDNRLSTGNAKTVYVYNLKRNAILEYSREIADPKLRELTPAERGVMDELKSGYGEARRNFRPRGARIANIPEKGRASRKETVSAAAEYEDFGGKGEDLGDDEPAWEEEE